MSQCTPVNQLTLDISCPWFNSCIMLASQAQFTVLTPSHEPKGLWETLTSCSRGDR